MRGFALLLAVVVTTAVVPGWAEVTNANDHTYLPPNRVSDWIKIPGVSRTCFFVRSHPATVEHAAAQCKQVLNTHLPDFGSETVYKKMIKVMRRKLMSAKSPFKQVLLDTQLTFPLAIHFANGHWRWLNGTVLKTEGIFAPLASVEIRNSAQSTYRALYRGDATNNGQQVLVRKPSEFIEKYAVVCVGRCPKTTGKPYPKNKPSQLSDWYKLPYSDGRCVALESLPATVEQADAQCKSLDASLPDTANIKVYKQINKWMRTKLTAPKSPFAAVLYNTKRVFPLALHSVGRRWVWLNGTRAAMKDLLAPFAGVSLPSGARALYTGNKKNNRGKIVRRLPKHKNRLYAVVCMKRICAPAPKTRAAGQTYFGAENGHATLEQFGDLERVNV